jgi:histidine ammonia-lyase
MTIILDGNHLTIEELALIAGEDPAVVELTPEGVKRVHDARAVVMEALERGESVYGLTTGLGSRASEMLDAEALAEFSYQAIRGRAHAIGESLSVLIVRAAMAVRLNTLLKGAAGADISVVECLQQCLNKGLIPVIGEVGSIGTGDLCWGATLGLALIGEGQMFDREGAVANSIAVMQAAGVTPLSLGPRDGLALANHSSFSAAMMALGVHRATRLMESIQSATALSMEAFMANLSPLDPIPVEMRPQPGQSVAAQQLLDLLQGSPILNTANARRLQDPLSIRNVSEVHGASIAALNFARDAAENEINGASDNPVVDLAQRRIISCGAYHTPLLSIAAQTLSNAFVHVATTQLSRIVKLLTERFSGLPQYLAAPGSNSNGFAPVLKIAEALVAELSHAAMPVPVWPSVNADGVEDIQTNAPTAIKALDRVVANAESLCAIELMVASQAYELRGNAESAPRIKSMFKRVREVSATLEQDRPLTKDIESVAKQVQAGCYPLDSD